MSRTRLDRMDGWGIDPDSGNVGHRSGKFFSVQGLDVNTDHRDKESWAQPIIVQPEIGILGIVVKMVGDTIYCLMQAKMEPGNINLLQLSPTVQATRSNYTRVHRGSPVPYLEHFVAPRSGRAVLDALQSEQGSWFLNKRNRNMIVQVGEDVPAHADFCWLSLEQVADLLKMPNLVNMDSRTVLSGMPFFFSDNYVDGVRAGGGAAGEWNPDDYALHSVEQLLSWFTEVKSRYRLARRLMPLSDVREWSLSSGRITHRDQKYFSVIGVDVLASSREVSQWSQPMLEPVARGVIGFLGRHVGQVFHVLVHARTEAGTHDVVEMAPTVSCIPASYAGQPAAGRPRYLAEFECADPARVLVDVVHSEEGGRFFHAENRYLVVDVGEDFDLDVPDDYCWMTVNQLTSFVRYGNHVNVAARCLLSCMVGEPARISAVGA
ncbi:MAG: NDP-hexose 2,3-dehydratase family protein [Sciscionella sp.]